MQNTDRDGSVFAHITRLDAVDSTNRHCRLLAKEGAPHGTVLIAQAQTAGRGRRGRDWQSPAGCGLWLSVLLRPDVDGSAYPLFSLAAALAVAEACEEVTGAQMGIKWPNDVVLMGKKIAGILVEREGEAVVVGMGINVRQRPEDFPAELRATAGSLEMLTD